jgi:uncharacterized protein
MVKKRTRKVKKRILYLLIIGTVFVQIVAYNHAYRFTHFIEKDANSSLTRITPENLSFFGKIKILLLGVPNTKPVTQDLPKQQYKTIKIQSNELLDSWWMPLADSTQKTKGIVILFHGYNGEKSSLLTSAATLNKIGYDCLLVDFMGSGGSTGRQTTIGFKEGENVKSAYDYIKQQYPTQKIILLGHSMGAVAIMKSIVDYDLKPDKIILQCPFGTMLETVKTRFKAMNVPSFPFAHLLMFYGGVQNGFNAFNHNPTDYAKHIKVPTLLAHGSQDKRVSRQEIEEIYNNLNGYKELLLLKKSGHEDYCAHSQTEWTNKIANFVD